MKVLVALCVLFVLFGLHQAKIIKFGEIENQKFIDRVAVFAPADPHGYITRMFTFPHRGPSLSGYVIKGIKQIESEDENISEVKIISGGIGPKQISIEVKSQYARPLTTIFEFYGQKH